jgi:hypothetical protein
LAAFSERVDQPLLCKRMINLMCYLLGAGNRVRFREFPRKWSHALAIVLLTRTGDSAPAGSQIVTGFMLWETHVSSRVIRSRKCHLSCACRTSRSCRAPSNRFTLK